MHRIVSFRKVLQIMSFELLKYYFGLMCLTPRSKRSDLIWNFIFVGDFAASFLSTLWFIVFVGRTLNEYSQSFHYMMCSLLTLSWYLTYCWQANKFSRLFVTLDELIETSKLFRNAKCFVSSFNEMNRSVWLEIFNFT